MTTAGKALKGLDTLFSLRAVFDRETREISDHEGSAVDIDGVDYQEVIDADSTPHSAALGARPVLLVQGFGGDGTFLVFGEFEDGEFLRLYVDFAASVWRSD